jgi:hypothetical protein
VTQDPAFVGQITGPLDIAGLDRWEDGAAVIRARLPVVPNAQAAMRRELLARVKTAFDVAGIANPTRRLRLTRESPTAD